MPVDFLNRSYTPTPSVTVCILNGISRSITNTKTENIEVYTQKYIWDIHALKPVSLPTKILYFGSY